MKFQNVSARKISGRKPNETFDLDADSAEVLRGSAAFRGGSIVELGEGEEPKRMPKARIPDIRKVKEEDAIRTIADMQSIDVLKAWWEQENDSRKPRADVLDAIKAAVGKASKA